MAVALLAMASPVVAQTKALRFGSLVDGTGQVIKDAVIVVDSDRITSVGSGNGAVPRGAQVIDLRRYTAIPGMIDVHTHMTYFWDQRPGTKPLGQPRRLAQVTVFLAQENARKTLETGVTTVRDLGSSEYNDIAMRDLINRGAMVGPRMFVVGYGLSHPRTPPRAGAPPGPSRGQVSDTTEIAEAVKAQVDAGADWIKMYGSTGTYADTSTRQTFTYEEMKAAVDAAHRAGKKIAIHSYGASGGRDAMRAGAESVEHAVDLDDATLAEMATRGTYYVPTIDHNRFYAENAVPFGFTPDQAKGLDEFRARNFETAQRAFKAGVKFAMGSDAVYTMFGENTRELGWYVKLGMTPAQALATATTGGAALLGMEKSLGRVSPGYFADIVAVEGDPLADINVAVSKVRWVMKGGAVVVDRRLHQGMRVNGRGALK
jgi:imidazolonepropionase-like amidohydrolase